MSEKCPKSVKVCRSKEKKVFLWDTSLTRVVQMLDAGTHLMSEVSVLRRYNCMCQWRTLSDTGMHVTILLLIPVKSDEINHTKFKKLWIFFPLIHRNKAYDEAQTLLRFGVSMCRTRVVSCPTPTHIITQNYVIFSNY